MSSINRRRFERIRLAHPVHGTVGSQSVLVRDLSLLGCGLEHPLPLQVGSTVKLSFPWNGSAVLIDSSVVRCKLERSLGRNDLSVYLSGLRFNISSGEPVHVLREIIAGQVSRALEAQKANARGDIPKYLQKMAIFRDGMLTAHPEPDDTYTSLPSMRIARARGFMRYSLEGGAWRKRKGQDPTQPPEGFTVWAYEDSEQLEQLCETYQRGDGDVRSLIRIIAELSLTVDDTIPPQAFTP